jgi:hypothetical protein
MPHTPPSNDPTAGLYLGSYGGPSGGAVSCERGTPVLTPPVFLEGQPGSDLGLRVWGVGVTP